MKGQQEQPFFLRYIMYLKELFLLSFYCFLCCCVFYNTLVFFLASLFAQVAILEAEEVEHAVKTNGVDALFGIGHHTWFGMESNAEARLAQHR